uniref:Uncharacterized protein n=1 Tax=Globisporangium ultimum (strain ATCC 200006 / CBS 805.95 / DAOM BR144) TaxID=431595 RepID=K3WWM8_GLOUD
MIFEFEQELEDNNVNFMSLAAHESGRNNTGLTFFGAASFTELRPPNPVAALLQSSEQEDESESNEGDEDSADEELKEFCPSPFRQFSRPPARAEEGTRLPAPHFSSERPLSFDCNDRRKRKCSDETTVGAYRVRPLAKRAKSFSFGRDSAALCMDYPTMFGRPYLESAVRSESISIPKPKSVRAVGRSRSYSGSALDACDSASSSHSHSSSSPSWNATASSLEYFCRRSLDVSSPLRLRFRDLMVGSVGRATSYNGP